MDKKDYERQCTNSTQELSIQIPCKLAERVDAFASKSGSTITNVVIEALDIFLRENKYRE